MTTSSRRRFIQISLGGLASGSACGPGTGRRLSGRRPNIVLIMADDMGFSDLGCYGSEIITPHLDGLAAKGIRFTQFYNAARCCPTRASVLTGLYPHQAGVGHMTTDLGKPGYRGELNRGSVTIAEVLKGAGYTTLMTGKWHVSRSRDNWPRQRGFDRFYGSPAGGGSYYRPIVLVRDSEQIEAPGDYYYTNAIADTAAQFIRDHGSNDKPFFLYVAFTAPHWPLHAPESVVARYRGRYDIGWDRLRAERHSRMIDLSLVRGQWPLTPRDDKVPSWETVEHKAWHARRMEVYAAQIDLMDQGIGRIVRALREMRLEENTLILFLSDNGGCAENISPDWEGAMGAEETTPRVKQLMAASLDKNLRTRDGRPIPWGNDPGTMPGPEDTYQSYGPGWANASNTPFRLYKHWVHEGGIATPLIAYWPGGFRQNGTLSHQPGHVIDIMATVIDLAGAEYPTQFGGHAIQPLEGSSLVPVFEGQQRESDKPIFWEHEGNRAVRHRNWKLVSRWRGQGQQQWELYDLDADRTEMNDLAASEPGRLAVMSAQYEEWALRAGVLPWRSWEH